MEEKEMALKKTRSDFEANEGYWERRRGVFMLRRWAELTGDYPTVSATDRFLRFCAGEDHAPA